MTNRSRLLSLGDSSQELTKFYENFAQHGTHMSVSSPTVAEYILNRLEAIVDVGLFNISMRTSKTNHPSINFWLLVPV